MKTPIPPFPEKEMCEYEKLMERNINERKLYKRQDFMMILMVTSRRLD